MGSGPLARSVLVGLVGLSLAGFPVAAFAQTAKETTNAGKRWEEEFAFWQKASSGSDVTQFENYLKQYPNGTFASMARLRIAELKAAGNAKPATTASDDAAAKAKADEAKAAEEAKRVADAEKAKAEDARKAAEAEKAKAEAAKAEEAAAAASKLASEKAAAEEKAKAEAAAAEKARAEEAARLKAEADRKAADERRVAAEKAAEAERVEKEAAAAAEKARADEAARVQAEAERRKADEAAAAEKARAEAEANARAAEAAAARAEETKRLEAEKAAAAEKTRLEQEAAAARKLAEEKTRELERLKAEAAKAAAEAEAKAAEASRLAAEARKRAEEAEAAQKRATTSGPATATNDNAEADRLAAAQREEDTFQKAVVSGSRQAFQAYLDAYPRGRYASDARERMAALATTPTQKVETERLVEERPVVDPREAYMERSTRVQAQRWLSALGYSTYGADGVFGPRTRAAIAAWQGASGYRADGYLSRRQFAALRQAAQFAEARQASRERRYQREYDVLEGPVDGYYDGPYYGDDGYYRPRDGVVIIPGY
ncbi:peptidoglycan-binding domain-containing protein [Shinella oryzae]|uniref:Peptidoglycan-binding domain-containing protein n=1 Tax=Shinella oryzae TaxID=2871820 RepID=A0ABY9K4N7_9HYPH|nr:peptidoglycan-binding protein [Shinella oryzae]WLS02581.1 peptidoglycan-binding domain-containing protein [Shinella oryzae]